MTEECAPYLTGEEVERNGIVERDGKNYLNVALAGAACAEMSILREILHKQEDTGLEAVREDLCKHLTGAMLLLSAMGTDLLDETDIAGFGQAINRHVEVIVSGLKEKGYTLPDDMRERFPCR